MPDESSLVGDLLDDLRLNAEKVLRGRHVLEDDHKLALWLFLYHKSSDVLVHSQLSHPTLKDMQTHAIVKTSQVLGGLGTIGFVLRTGKTEVVIDTFNDPRGTVAVQDYLIKNYSWCGVPIKKRTTDRIPVGIASFFPVSVSSDSLARWNSGDISILQTSLTNFVKYNKKIFCLLCELSLGRNSNTFLKSSFLDDLDTSFEDASFESKIGTLLRQLLSLGSPYAKLPYVAYLEGLDEKRANGDHSYTCHSSSALRCNVETLRVGMLENIQWKAIYPSDFLDDIFLKLDTEIMTIPLQTGGLGPSGGLDLALHLPAGGTRIKALIEEVYEPWKPLFSAIHRAIVNATDMEPQKILSESAASLFALLAHSSLSDRTPKQFSKLVVDLADQLGMLISFLGDTYDIHAEPEMLVAHIKRIVRLEKEFESARLDIVALSLWHSTDAWTISTCTGFHKAELYNLKRPGNWKVIQRAVHREDESILRTYRPINWPNIKDWTLVNMGDNRQISWSDKRSDKVILFSWTKCYFPLDLQMCGMGFAQHLFEGCRDSPLTLVGDDQLEAREILRSIDDVHYRLGGRYRVLATNKRRAIVIGPLKGSSKDVEIETQATLEQFAQKELHVVLVSEYANRVTEASRRAAVAAIMARNASHNIGSHVLARHAVKNIDNDFTSRGTPRRSRLISPSLFSFTGKTGILRKGILPRLRVELRDVQFLERYLQGRMDFVAQISTEWPEWTEASRLTGELLWGFLAQRILLEEIVASEGIGALEWEARSSERLARGTGRDGEIRFTCMAVSQTSWIPKVKYAAMVDRILDGEAFLSITPSDARTGLWRSKVSLHKDPLVAVPGGVTGWHAFYIVLENLIRNAAKHGKWKSARGHHRQKVPLDVVVEILDDEEHESYAREIKQGRAWAHPALLCRIYDNVSRLRSGTLSNINDILNKGLIDDSGHLRREHWGLAEMKMAVAFLQRRPIGRLGGSEGAITGNTAKPLADGEEGGAIIRAVQSPLNTLGYEFLLLKPRTLGISPTPS